MRTDEICKRYSDRSVSLSLPLIQDDEDNSRSIVLMECSPDGLRMLAELLLAVAEEVEKDGFSISPFGAGSTHFAPNSELGLYIYRADPQ
jgi:hypothetical protein